MKKLFFPLAVVFSISTACAQPLTFNIYTDETAWAAALAADPSAGDQDAFGAGQTLGNLSVETTTGSIGAPRGVFPAGTNVWTDSVTAAGGEITTFSDGDGDPNQPFIAFGGYWDFSPAGLGEGLTLTVASGLQSSHIQDICGDTVNGCAGGPTQATLVPNGTFFGIIATSGSFDSMSISADHQPGVAETFDLSALDLVHSTVPEPATFFLFGAGLVGLGLLKRIRS